MKLDYKDLTGTATIKLEWKHVSDAATFTVIPSERLANRSVPPPPPSPSSELFCLSEKVHFYVKL